MNKKDKQFILALVWFLCATIQLAVHSIDHTVSILDVILIYITNIYMICLILTS